MSPRRVIDQLRNLFCVSLALYGMLVLLLFLIALLWDNKGAESVWDKSIVDWMTVVWLALSSSLILYASRWCILGRRASPFFLLLVGIAIVLNMTTLLSGAEGDALLYLGLPHFLGVIGVLGWAIMGNVRAT